MWSWNVTWNSSVTMKTQRSGDGGRGAHTHVLVVLVVHVSLRRTRETEAGREKNKWSNAITSTHS